MSKSVLYAANTNTQTVASGSAVNFGSVVRRFGNCIGINANGITANASGYYDIIVNLSFTAGAGTAQIQVTFDGTPVVGAVAEVTTEATNSYSVTIPAVVRKFCPCDGGSAISVTASGETLTVENASILVEKL